MIKQHLYYMQWSLCDSILKKMFWYSSLQSRFGVEQDFYLTPPSPSQHHNHNYLSESNTSLVFHFPNPLFFLTLFYFIYIYCQLSSRSHGCLFARKINAGTCDVTKWEITVNGGTAYGQPPSSSSSFSSSDRVSGDQGSRKRSRV